MACTTLILIFKPIKLGHFLSCYFGDLSDFLARFSRLALRLLLLAFFDRSVYFFSAYFHSKRSLNELELY